MKITLNRTQILAMFSQKLGVPESEIELDLQGCLEDVPVDGAVAPVPEEDAEDEDTEINMSSTASDIVRVTKIDKVLEKTLTDLGHSNKIPKNSVDVCTKAAEKLIDKMSRKERKLFNTMVSEPNFKAFALLWQEFQTLIQKSM